jgi:predicted nuclease of predicted toxin-antitoxin system
MRFLVDECTGPGVARWLSSKGHHVVSVYDDMRGASDTEILEYAFKNGLILITNDKDFGELVFKHSMKHTGIVLLRLSDQRKENKIDVLEKLLSSHENDLENGFLVVNEKNVRIKTG